MFHKKRASAIDESIVKNIISREFNGNNYERYASKLQVTKSMIDRLSVESHLSGHDGCVNCVQWNEDGSVLMSASDDANVILWDPYKLRSTQVMKTIHNGNIFSAKFVPGSSNHAATGSADGLVLVHDLDLMSCVLSCSCSMARVKRLAVARDVPFVIWSACEDGRVRQIDSRCHRECKTNTSLFLNLTNHIGQAAEIKCVAVNPVRSELLAVGANDPYVRIYDRRKIKLTSEEESTSWVTERYTNDNSQSREARMVTLPFPWNATDNIPVDAVEYYCSGHINKTNVRRTADIGTLGWQHLGISFISFSDDGRQMLANYSYEQVYSFNLVKKRLPPDWGLPKRSEPMNGKIADIPGNYYKNNSILPNHLKKLKDKANKHFQNKEYMRASALYDELISKHKHSSVLYANRAAALMKRDWWGDWYAALRDCQVALKYDPMYKKAMYRLIKCLNELGYDDETLELISSYDKLFPDSVIGDTVLQKILLDIRERSSHGITQAKHLKMSVNELNWCDSHYDYENRFCGRANTATDIKEASFFGRNGDYVVAGSDDGNIFVWNHNSCNLVRIMHADSAIVNCVQPHPFLCLLASSGIDSDVRIWTPLATPNDDSEEDIARQNNYYDEISKKNQRRMKDNFYAELVVIDEHDTDSDEGSESSADVFCRTS